MGAWGLAIDETDWTFDAIGPGIMERMNHLLHPLALINHDQFVQEIYNDNDDNYVPVGVAIFRLKMGCALRQPTLAPRPRRAPSRGGPARTKATATFRDTSKWYNGK